MRAPSLLALGFTGVLLSMPLQAAPEYEKRADLSEQLAQWVKQALGGDASAQRELAQRYYDGDGVEQDYAKAFELYSEAAEQGDAAAEFSVAYMYDFGEGVELDVGAQHLRNHPLGLQGHHQPLRHGPAEGDR